MVRAVVATIVFCLAGSMYPVSYADSHGSVRIYRLNSKDQLVKNRWVKKSHRSGCRDLRGKKKVHRFAQVGFAWCTVYAEGDCAAGSEMAAMWGGNSYRTADIDITRPQVKLLPGAKWYLDPEKNLRMGSWYCQYDAPG